MEILQIRYYGEKVKMYRQFQIDQKNKDWLKIFYVINEKIVDFGLSTVTYGIRCARFLALKMSLQAVQEIGQEYEKVFYFLKKFRHNDIF